MWNGSPAQLAHQLYKNGPQDVVVLVEADDSKWIGSMRFRTIQFAEVSFKYHAIYVDFDLTYAAALQQLAEGRPIKY